MFTSLKNLFSNDVGIDLGTMNTLVYRRGNGVVLEEPTVVAVDTRTNEVFAVGADAKKMLGMNPGCIRAVRPMKNGVIKEPNVTDRMLHFFLEASTHSFSLMQPRVVVAVPSRITTVESQAVCECIKRAGARDVRIVEEPLAAAIGAELPTSEPVANMIVDIGGGTAEIAIISLGSIVRCYSVPFAGDAMDDAIIAYMKKKHNLSIGELTAERIKIEIGSVVPYADFGDEEKTMMVYGLQLQNVGDNLPGAVSVTSDEIRSALLAPVGEILNGIQKVLDCCPAELAGGLVSNGLTITGGGSCVRGLDILISRRFNNLAVYRDKNPKQAVIRGIGRIVEKYPIFKRPQVELVGVNVS